MNKTTQPKLLDFFKRTEPYNALKYKEGKIYKLINNEMPNIVYYGSTIQPLKHRLCQHKSPSNMTSSKVLFEYGNVEMILIENYPCNSKDELVKRERDYIKGKACINKVIPGRTDKEYYEDNKELIMLQNKEYYEKNKDKRKAYKKANKEKIALKKKEYYEANKEKIALGKKEKFECECGSTLSKSANSRHIKRNKHLKYVNDNKKKIKFIVENS